jgi:pyrimidine deaminase RibD-like protein
MTPEKFMARAIEIGRAGLRTKDARPFAAVVVRQGKIVGEGRSQQKTCLTRRHTARLLPFAMRAGGSARPI